jgi:Putative DNA-binding domain
MPTLLEIERAAARGILTGDMSLAAPFVVGAGLEPEARLRIHGNNFLGTLTKALRLTYPAVARLVGEEFFETAARIFIAEEPPSCADLDAYGEGFPAFLAGFPPAAAVPYLAGVARLEWKIARARHATDARSLDPRRLERVAAADRGRIAFLPHPAVGFVAADHPVDAVCRAVLAQDEAAMAGIDLKSGPTWLLIERRESEVAVIPLPAAEWRFAQALCDSKPLAEALAEADGIDPALALAEHLAAGRFVGVTLVEGCDLSA